MWDFMPRPRGIKLFLKRIAVNKTVFQSKNLISMKARTTFCIFYCRPCNLWNVCTREPTREYSRKGSVRARGTHTKNVKCKIQKNFWPGMIPYIFIARTIGCGRAIVFDETVVSRCVMLAMIRLLYILYLAFYSYTM